MSENFFDRNCEERVEIIEGILREGQLGAFAGPFGIGKSPVLADLALRLVHGLEWCGRKLERRPVIAVDCESAGPDYRRTITNIAARFGVAVPCVPDDLDVYLEHDNLNEPSTAKLVTAVSQQGHEPKLLLLESALTVKPNAVIFIDPLEMLFRFDTLKKTEVLSLYRDLRNLLAKFPHAAIVGTFNLRKKDKKNGRADLFTDPRDWLEEVCGSLDLMNRCDVRLGVDIVNETRGSNDDVRVINGVIRGREMHKLLIRPFSTPEGTLAGFEQVAADEMELVMSLTPKQKEHWDKLPQQFTFEEIADKVVPRSTLSRLTKLTTSLGVLIKGHDGTFKKSR